jgi:CO/xanthine dehydrogenase Mo-binding subunit
MDRRAFLKASGVLVVFIASLADEVGAQAPTAAAAGPFQRGLTRPDRTLVDAYFEIRPDNTVTFYSGYVDFGQGGPTALQQVVAEELDLDFDQVITARPDSRTAISGGTYASRTAGIGGVEMRAAAAEARRALLEAASVRLQAPVADLVVAKGVVSVRSAPQRSVTYAELLAGKTFDRKFEQHEYFSVGWELPRKGTDHAVPKPRDQYTIVGTKVPRPDIAEKVRGTYQYIQHVRVPGMLHGRVVMPRGQGAEGLSIPTVVSIDESSIKDIPGVQVVRRENFVGVVAEREWDAVRAARQLKVTWAPFVPQLPGHEALFDYWKTVKVNQIVEHDVGDVDAALPRGVHMVTASYRGPYQAHGAMAPSCAVADVRKDGATIYSPSGVDNGAFVRVTGLPPDKVHVVFYPGSNGYAGGGKSAPMPAVIMSQAVGKPVRVQYSREDENGWDSFGPALLSEIKGAVDASGKLVALEYQGWSHSAGGGPIRRAVPVPGLHPWHMGNWDGGTGNNDIRLLMVHQSQMDMYDIPNLRIVNQRVADKGYLRTSALRAPMEPNTFFALEGIMDELAHAAGLDPYEFRKRNVSNPRWLGVLKAATDAAKWTPRVAASTRSTARVVTGRGLGFGTHHVELHQGTRVTHAAAVVDLEVNKDTGVILVKHVYTAMDCGLALNPGIVESQMVGGAVHGVSIALREEVQFNQTNVSSLDWNSYPTLRHADHPTITPILVQKLHEPSCGAGEETVPAVVAAIGNAVFDATGVRMRQIPLTPNRVRAALTAV